jgi:hypothetical protein
VSTRHPPRSRTSGITGINTTSFSRETNPSATSPLTSAPRCEPSRALASVTERCAAMAGAEGGVVFDAHLGGLPLTVTLPGIESRPLRPIGSCPPTPPAATTPGGAGQPRASTARRLCMRSSSSTGPRSAARSSTFDGPIVLCVVSSPRRSLRSLGRAHRQRRGDRGRGRVRAGHRRDPVGRDRVRPRDQRPHRRRCASFSSRPPGRRGARERGRLRVALADED